MKLYSDGYTIGSNPSVMGGGFTIFNEKGVLLLTTRVEKTNFTSNEAELLGILGAAKLAKKNDEIITDSMNSIHWVRRGAAKARPDLNSKIKKINSFVRNKELKVKWEPRESNLAGHYNESLEIEPQWKQLSKSTKKKEQLSLKETNFPYQIPLF